MNRIEVADGSLVKMRDISEGAYRMFEQRVILEKLGVQPHDLPLCEDETAAGLSTYFERVKLECLIRARSDSSTKEIDRDLWNYMRNATHDSPYAIEYWTFITTMQVLSEFGVMTNRTDEWSSMGNVNTTSSWRLSTDPSLLVEIIDELNVITLEALESTNMVGLPKLLKGAHYFGISADLLAPLCPGTDSDHR